MRTGQFRLEEGEGGVLVDVDTSKRFTAKDRCVEEGLPMRITPSPMPPLSRMRASF